MRWFKRKEKKKTDEAAMTPSEEEPARSSIFAPLSSELEVLDVVADPVEAFILRLELFLKDPEIAAKSKAILNTKIQLIVGGTPVLLYKEGVAPLSLSRERSVRSDVFIRLSENAAKELASTTTIPEFGKTYHQLVKSEDVSSFISVKLHTDLTELRRRGFFSIDLLRTLIDA